LPGWDDGFGRPEQKSVEKVNHLILNEHFDLAPVGDVDAGPYDH
jgi:hypothetical protein